MPQGKRILIVDDDPGIRDVIADFLTRHGYRVDQAADARAMETALQREAPDLVVLDVMMPGEDGVSLTRSMRGTLGVPILQGYGQTEAGPAVSCSPPDRIRIETVGPPLKGIEVAIAQDGEILIRGEVVMTGYWNDPVESAQALRDGWYFPGDMFRFAGSRRDIMDEAYQPFSSHSWLDEIRAHPAANANVLLMRTLSKFGLAGVRLGYMLGPQALVHEVDKLRPPYNVSVLNAECALFALEHADVFAAQAATIRSERERLIAALAAMPGVRPFPSQANMVLVRLPDAQKAFDGLKARGVLVKNVSKMHPLLAQCLRLTVGTPDENTQMIAALQHSL